MEITYYYYSVIIIKYYKYLIVFPFLRVVIVVQAGVTIIKLL